ncbi:MAG: response regulator [Flavitalea sp.]
MILIVDDKQENLFSLQRLLQIHNFKVDTASSGAEALKKILRNFYALIILDVQMPDMDGFEVAEALSGYGKSKDIPIIFLSAVKINKTFITRGYHSGGIDYVTKPFDPDVLLLKVKTFYRLSEQRRELNDMQNVLREEIEFRKKAEKELSHSIEELRSILESIPQIAYITDANGIIEFVNQFWYKYSTDKNIFPQSDNETISLKSYMNTAIKSGEQQVVEVCIRELNHPKYRYHRLSMTPVKKEGQTVRWVNILTDIHDQKMVNQVLEQRVAERTEELFKLNTQLELSNNDLQQYASVASHDLKEPLRKIQIYSDRIKMQSDRNNPEAEMYMDKVITSSQRMTILINDLLNYSRLSGEGHFKVSNINDIFAELIADLELLIGEKNATIKVSNFPEMEVIPGQIRQLFQNIITNSIKFSKKDIPPVIEVNAEIINEKNTEGNTVNNGNFCRIIITDNGIGFNEMYKDKIFTMFQRLHSKEKFEGTGIGLAIVKKIIEKHSGIISVTSKENEGTTLTLVLPVYQSKSIPAREISLS